MTCAGAVPEEGLRERKKRSTRQALSSAALRLAAERGPERVTVEAISDAAGVSARTFFNYFATKEDAILGSHPDAGADLRQRLEARPPHESPLDALHAVLVAESATLEQSMDEWATRMRLVREHPALFPGYVARFATVERVLVEAVAARSGVDPDAELGPSLLVGAALTSMRIAVNHWQARGRATPLPVLLDEAFRRLGEGFAVAPPKAAVTTRPRATGDRTRPLRAVDAR